MDKVSLVDRLCLSYLIEKDRKDEFYQLISEFIYEDGLNNYYLNMLKTAYNKWHKEVSNDY